MQFSRIDLPRFGIASLFSLTVTIGLLLLMRFFVSSDDAAYTERPPPANLVFLRTVPDREPEVKKPPPERPPPIEPPPKLPPHSGPVDDGDGFPVGYIPVPPATTGTSLSMVESRAAVPLLTPAPEYPQRLLARGIEGWVLVSFTVTETGSVTDAVVLDSQPKGAFDAAALRTLARYRYHPQLVGGEPAAMPGLSLRIVFEIDNG